MADAMTANYGWTKPEVGASADTWGNKENANLDGIDAVVFGKLNKAGDTMTGPLVFAPSSATQAAGALQAGAVQTAPVAHSIEWDGTKLYLTTAAGARKTVAYTDGDITGKATTAGTADIANSVKNGAVGPAGLSAGGMGWTPNGSATIANTTTDANVLLVSTGQTGTTARSNVALRLQSLAAGRDVAIQLSDNVANAAEVGMLGGGLYLATGGVERARIDNAGRVGIGTRNPIDALDVVGVSRWRTGLTGATALTQITNANADAWADYQVSAKSFSFAPGGNSNPLMFDAYSNLGVANVPMQNNGRLQVFHGNAGNPATSGVTDVNTTSRFSVGDACTDFGFYSSGNVWLQTRRKSDFSSNFSLYLNPNGGVVIANNNPVARMNFGNSTNTGRISIGLGGPPSSLDPGELYFQIAS